MNLLFNRYTTRYKYIYVTLQFVKIMEKILGGQTFFFGWFIVFATALINAFGIGLFSSILGLFFTPMSQVHGFSQTGISSIIAFAMIGGMCAAAGLGSVYQRFGLRYVLFILGMGQAVTLALMALPSTLPLLYAVSFFLGFFTFGTGLSAPTLVTNWFDQRRGMAMGISMAGAGFGPAILAPFISVIIADQGYKTGFYTLAATLFFSMLVIVFIVRDKPYVKGLKPYGLNDGDSQPGNQEKTKTQIQEYSYRLKEAVKTKGFVFLMLLGISAGAIVQGVLIQIPSFLSKQGFNAAAIGGIVGSYALIAAMGKILIGWVYDKMGYTIANFIFFSCMGLSFISLALVQSFNTMIYLYVLLAGLGMGVNIVAIPLFTSAIFGQKYYATIFPILSLSLGIGAIAGSIVSGILIDISGFSSLFYVAAVGAWMSLLFAQVALKVGIRAKKKIEATMELNHA